jgi:hypothetical protein
MHALLLCVVLASARSDQAKNLEYEIKTGMSDAADHAASIEGNADLKAATAIHSQGSVAFATDQKVLSEIINTLECAVGNLERELAKGDAALLQAKYSPVAQAWVAIMDASLLSTADTSKLTASLQNSQDAADDATKLDAPVGAVYESHSDNIVDPLNGLLDKAAAIKSFNEYPERCEDQAKILECEIKIHKGDAVELQAII